MAAASTKPALCVDCEEAPARRLVDDRWVCERCCTEAALDADRARRGPEPPPERRDPEPKMWHVGTYGGVFRCVQTNPRGTQLLECGQRHPTRDAAQAHCDALNAAMANYAPVRALCATHQAQRRQHAAWRTTSKAGSQCPVCETTRYVRSLLSALPEQDADRWDELNEWEQGFLTSVRSQVDEDLAMTTRQLEQIETLYRRLHDEPEPV